MLITLACEKDMKPLYHAIVGSLLCGACTSDVQQPTQTQFDLRPLPSSRNPDDEIAQLSKDIPGFAGYYFDSNMAFVIVLKNPDEESLAAQRLSSIRQFHETQNGIRSTALRFVRGEFAGIELYHYKKIAQKLLSNQYVQFVDLDEVANRVTVGISEESARSGVLQLLSARGVPLNAVNIVIEGGTDIKGLNQPFDPIIGGLKLELYWPNLTFHPCSYAATVMTNAGRGLVTASHCTWSTTIAGGADGTLVGQPAASAPWTFGYEYSDPAFKNVYLNAECPYDEWTGLLYYCRYSDSAVFLANNPNEPRWIIGRVALHALGTPDVIDSLTTISSAYTSPPPIGTQLARMGATSGRTNGSVTRTCVDRNARDRTGGTIPYALWLCQTYMGAYSQAGDSGSPVVNLNVSPWKLAGIAWFATTANETIFSSWGGVLADHGSAISYTY